MKLANLSVMALAALVLSFTTTVQAGSRVGHCGGLNEPACYIWEAIPICDPLPFLYHEFVWFQRGYCRAWNPSCGGLGERPCTIFEHVPSCDSGLIEEPLFAPTCSLIGPDGFPVVCGADEQPACTITTQLALGIRSCKPNHFEQILTHGLIGTCHEIQYDGYPDYCGHIGQPACTLEVQVQLGINSCKAGSYEHPPPFGSLIGTCRERDRWGWPLDCGDVGEPQCNLLLLAQNIHPCKPGLVALPFGTCFTPPLDNDLYPEFCGGAGETACHPFLKFVRRVGDCKPGLVHIPGTPLGTCEFTGPSPNEPGVQTTAVAQTSPVNEPVRGYADVHNHMFANESFGGTTIVGKTFHPYGVEAALENGYRFHGLLGVEDLMGNLKDYDIFTDDPAEGRGWHRTGGWPGFEWWPRWNSFTHMMHYHRWLQRAFLGGQRLMVIFAMNNEYACLRVSNASPFQTTIPGYACDDMAAADRQIQAAYDLVAYIDSQAGGPGSGWLQIAKSSAEARQIISEGKMAMVLGIEIDTPFGCRKGECTGDYDYIDQQVDAYYAKGVRAFFPIHAADNAFGGAAVFQDAYNTVNYFLNHEFLSVQDCASIGLDNIEYDANMEPTFWFGAYLEGAPVAVYPSTPGGHCNQRGLTPIGAHLVNKLMDKGIIIDTEHMSYLMKETVMQLAAERGVPLVATHVLPLKTHHNQSASEFANTDAHILAMLNNGGLVAPMVAQWHEDTKWETAEIKDDCNGSSKEFAQSYVYLLGLLAQSESPYNAIPLATDTHGFIYQPAPRFGPDACKWDAGERAGQLVDPKIVEYPFEGPLGGWFDRQVTGNRTFDYNTDGLAHVGLLPDFIEDLKNVGVTEAQLEPLFNSAEAYLQMWERVEQASLGNPPGVPRDLVARAKDHHVNVAWSGAERADFCRVYRRLDGETEFSLQGETTTSVFVDDLPRGTSLAEYFVIAVNVSGESADSDIVAVAPTTRMIRR